MCFTPGSSESGSFQEEKEQQITFEKWLSSLKLEEYVKTFETNLLTDMDRVMAIWDDELTSILDIEKIGHRKRILLSLAGRSGMPHRFGKVQASPKAAAFFVAHFLPFFIICFVGEKTKMYSAHIYLL